MSDLTDVAVTFFVTGSQAAAQARWRVRLIVQYGDGAQDEIVAWQPIGRAAPADAGGAAVAIGGELITIGGQPIQA